VYVLPYGYLHCQIFKTNHHTGTILHDQSSHINITPPNIAQANIIEYLRYASLLTFMQMKQNFQNTNQVIQSMHNEKLLWYSDMS
jgi:hypothetical protein